MTLIDLLISEYMVFKIRGFALTPRRAKILEVLAFKKETASIGELSVLIGDPTGSIVLTMPSLIKIGIVEKPKLPDGTVVNRYQLVPGKKELVQEFVGLYKKLFLSKKGGEGR